MDSESEIKLKKRSTVNEPEGINSQTSTEIPDACLTKITKKDVKTEM